MITNGKLVWKFTTGDMITVSSPAISDGRVFIGSNDHKIYAIDASNGDLLWNYTTNGFVVSSPSVAAGLVYVGSYDHEIYALNATTGHVVWNFTTGGVVGSSPAA